jgi:hypothetical protein
MSNVAVVEPQKGTSPIHSFGLAAESVFIKSSDGKWRETIVSKASDLVGEKSQTFIGKE